MTESSGTLVSPIQTMLTPLSLVTLVTTPSMRPLAVVVIFEPSASVAVTLMVYSPPSGCWTPSGVLLPSHLKVWSPPDMSSGRTVAMVLPNLSRTSIFTPVAARLWV